MAPTLPHIFYPLCIPSHLGGSSTSEIGFDKLVIINVAKGKDLPLHRSNTNLYLSHLLPKEDLELHGSCKDASALKARDTLFDSSLRIYSPVGSSNH